MTLDRKLVENLLEKITSEIAQHRENPEFEFTQNIDLQKQFKVSSNSFIRYCKIHLTKEDRSYRKKFLKISIGKRIGSNFEHLTYEEKKANAKRKNEIHGNPFDKFTFEQRSAAGKIGGKKTKEGYGVSEKARKQRIAAGIKSSQVMRKSRYLFQGNHFDSQSEGTVGYLLEKYLPDFKIKEGETFQVNHEIPKSIDFLVGETFLEWHPILLFKGKGTLGDFKTFSEYQEFQKIVQALPERKKDIERVYKEALAKSYFNSRAQAIAQSQSYSSHDLVLVQTPEDVYDFLPTRTTLPSREDFVKEFKQTKKQVAKENSVKTNELNLEMVGV